MSESDNIRPRRKKLTLGANPKTERLTDDSAGVEEGALQTAPPPPDDARAYTNLQLGFTVAVVTGLLTALLGYVQGLEGVGFAGPMLSIIGFYIFGKLQGFVERPGW